MSVAYSQSELLKKEVFLVELVDSISKSREHMSHLKAIYFVAPSSENIQYLRRHLATPRFGEYHLCKFSSCSFSYQVCMEDTQFVGARFLCHSGNYSFLKHIEGHADSYISRFR